MGQTYSISFALGVTFLLIEPLLVLGQTHEKTHDVGVAVVIFGCDLLPVLRHHDPGFVPYAVVPLLGWFGEPTLTITMDLVESEEDESWSRSSLRRRGTEDSPLQPDATVLTESELDKLAARGSVLAVCLILDDYFARRRSSLTRSAEEGYQTASKGCA